MTPKSDKDKPARRDFTETAGVRQTAIIGGAKPKRDRSWDEAHAADVATYRITHGLKESIKAVSEEVGVSSSEVGRAFLEYGLTAYRNGDLHLTPVPVEKKTLFPK